MQNGCHSRLLPGYQIFIAEEHVPWEIHRRISTVYAASLLNTRNVYNGSNELFKERRVCVDDDQRWDRPTATCHDSIS